MSARLRLEIDPATCEPDEEMSRISVYESSVTEAGTDAPLLSVATRGPGMRLTISQVHELVDWIGEWIDEIAARPA